MRRIVLATIMMVGSFGCREMVKTPEAETKPTIEKAAAVEAREAADAVSHRASDPNAPTDQKNPTDDEITSKIVSRMTDSKMAKNLENVKIQTQDGKVALRGLVKTAEEKQRVEEIANEVAGTGNVHNYLEVE